MPTAVLPDVRPGQIWADNDRRSAGRTLRVDAVEDGKVTCTVLTNSDALQAVLDTPVNLRQYTAKDARGLVTRIAQRRFVATSTGYALVTDVS